MKSAHGLRTLKSALDRTLDLGLAVWLALVLAQHLPLLLSTIWWEGILGLPQSDALARLQEMLPAWTQVNLRAGYYLLAVLLLAGAALRRALPVREAARDR